MFALYQELKPYALSQKNRRFIFSFGKTLIKLKAHRVKTVLRCPHPVPSGYFHIKYTTGGTGD